MSARGPIPLYVIGGFLGAGKTTLLNDILARGALRAGVLVNDFGAIHIDSALISGAAGRVARLANGCVCCSLGDDLLQALGDVVEAGDDLDAILIEASGVGDPWRIAEIAYLDKSLTLGAVLCVADATAIAGQLNDARIGDTLRRQIEGADIVVLSKTDLVESEAQAAAVAAIRSARGDARIVGMAHGALPLELFDLPHDARARARETIRHENLFARFAYARDGAFDRAKLQAALTAAPQALLRLKGFCALSDGSGALVQMVGARASLTPVAWRGGVALAGVLTPDASAAAALERQLDSALATPERGRAAAAAFFKDA